MTLKLKYLIFQGGPATSVTKAECSTKDLAGATKFFEATPGNRLYYINFYCIAADCNKDKEIKDLIDLVNKGQINRGNATLVGVMAEENEKYKKAKTGNR